MPLDRRRFFALAFLGGLFIEFAAAKFGQDARLFTGTFEATQGSVKILIFLDTDTRHTFIVFGSDIKKPGTGPGLNYT